MFSSFCGGLEFLTSTQWNKPYPFSNGVSMASVWLFSSMRRHCFKVHRAILGDLNSAPVYDWQGHIWFSLVFVFQSPVHSLLVYSAFTPSFSLYSLSHSFFFSLTPSHSFCVCLSRFDLLAMNQGWGSMPEERLEHSGKWLFPARLHIRMGKCARACICVCVCVRARLSPSSPTGDQRRAALWLCLLLCNNPLIVFKWNPDKAF